MLRHVAGMDAARREGWLDEPGDEMLEAFSTSRPIRRRATCAVECTLAIEKALALRTGKYIRREVSVRCTEVGSRAAGTPSPRLEEWAGSDMPCTVGTALMEMWTSANMGFATGHRC